MTKIRSSLLTAALAVALFGLRGGGFMIYLVVLALAIWIPYSAYVVITKPDVRTTELVRVLIWMLVVPVVYGIHYIRHATLRRSADEIVAAISNFSRTHGHYPATIDEIGMSRRQVGDRLGSLSGYFVIDGKPSFGYRDTFTPFAYCSYRFETSSWECRPD